MNIILFLFFYLLFRQNVLLYSVYDCAHAVLFDFTLIF